MFGQEKGLSKVWWGLAEGRWKVPAIGRPRRRECASARSPQKRALDSRRDSAADDRYRVFRGPTRTGSGVLVENLHERPRSSNLCLAGGVVSNCVTNRHTFERGQFARLFIQPVGPNALPKGCEDHIEIGDGTHDIFAPVCGQRFDYVMSNPPFVPTPPGPDFFVHWSAGPYGTDFTEGILRELDTDLSEEGYAEIVMVAPGDGKRPFLLLEPLHKHLSGTTLVKVNPEVGSFGGAEDWLRQAGAATEEQASEMKTHGRPRWCIPPVSVNDRVSERRRRQVAEGTGNDGLSRLVPAADQCPVGLTDDRR